MPLTLTLSAKDLFFVPFMENISASRHTRRPHSRRFSHREGAAGMQENRKRGRITMSICLSAGEALWPWPPEGACLTCKLGSHNVNGDISHMGRVGLGEEVTHLLCRPQVVANIDLVRTLP